MIQIRNQRIDALQTDVDADEMLRHAVLLVLLAPADRRYEALEAAPAYAALEIVQAVHEQLREKIEQHKEMKNPEPLEVTAQDVSGILKGCGVAEEQIAVFREECDRRFGADAALSPANLIDSKRYEIKTENVTVSVAPEASYLVETRMIEGKKYILIPVEAGMEINGMTIDS